MPLKALPASPTTRSKKTSNGANGDERPKNKRRRRGLLGRGSRDGRGRIRLRRRRRVRPAPPKNRRLTEPPVWSHRRIRGKCCSPDASPPFAGHCPRGGDHRPDARTHHPRGRPQFLHCLWYDDMVNPSSWPRRSALLPIKHGQHRCRLEAPEQPLRHRHHGLFVPSRSGHRLVHSAGLLTTEFRLDLSRPSPLLGQRVQAA